MRKILLTVFFVFLFSQISYASNIGQESLLNNVYDSDAQKLKTRATVSDGTNDVTVTSNKLNIRQAAGSSIATGRKVITATEVGSALASPTAVRKVTLRPEKTNTSQGAFYVGNSASGLLDNGFVISGDANIEIEVDNLADVYVTG